MTNLTNLSLLQVRIISPREVIYQGPAYAISSINSAGKFDILPEHANFLTIIENQPIRLTKEDRSVQDFSFDQAIIYHTGNQVSIYANPKMMTEKSKPPY